ncbi:MAG: 1-acyl-sn-glycerol-3-phosphate acyltransferase [Bacteroidota bacterium]|nr:1-acyl-sn-glycerol-3-phosphate acyltransferase [Bacteroidota bacterium]
MIILRFFKTLFGIYAALFFMATLLITTPLYFFVFLTFSSKKAPHIAHKIISRSWARVLTWAFLIPVKIKNSTFIDPRKAYVMIANHRSQLDIPLYALASKNTLRFLAKAELTKIPLLGFIIRKLYMTVNRTDRADRNRSIEIMRKSLDENISVFLCPEGTRNRHDDPPLLDFRDGAFRLAILTKTPIAVLTLLNTGEKLSPLRPAELAPGTLHAIWDEPIDTCAMTIDDVPALKEKVRQMMIGHLMEYRKTGKVAR